VLGQLKDDAKNNAIRPPPAPSRQGADSSSLGQRGGAAAQAIARGKCGGVRDTESPAPSKRCGARHARSDTRSISSILGKIRPL
jgi:hypothetical protein